MKNQGLNKTVCSMTTNFDATLMFSIYSKYKEDKETFSLYIIMSINEQSLCKHKYASGKPMLGDVR
jgi:hypothetical protein